jgi:hypothetical protein
MISHVQVSKKEIERFKFVLYYFIQIYFVNSWFCFVRRGQNYRRDCVFVLCEDCRENDM